MNNGQRISVLVNALVKSQYPFKYRIYNTLLRMGLLNGSVSFNLSDGPLEVPSDEWYFWLIRDAAEYQYRRVNTLCSLINDKLDEFDLLDLGADVGVVSRLIHSKCPNICSITAVEPNPGSFSYLSRNLDTLRIPTRVLNIAVSDYSGRATLEFDRSHRSDHSGYIKVNDAGDTRVNPVDVFFVPKVSDLVLKIDVEGQERAVYRGATRTIQGARAVAIFMELHRDVIERTGISAESLLEAAEAIRPCEWFLSEPELPKIDRNRSFWEQFPSFRQHDVIGLMLPA